MNLLLKFLIVASFLSIILFNYQKYLSKFDYVQTKNNYDNSPYVLGDKYKTIIDDQDNDAWQGVNYVRRINLDETLYDHPPFGKLLIGFSILFTGNQNIMQIFISIAALVSFYYLSKEILISPSLSLLSTMLLSLEPLYREQVYTSLLDQSLLLFLILTFIFILKSLENHKWIIASMISIGFFSSIKFPSNTFLLVASILAFYLFVRRFDLIKILLKYSVVIPLIYVALFVPFIENTSLNKFINLQIFALKWHISHLPDYPKGEIFRLLIFNSWRTWWGDKQFISVPYFHIGWPLSALSLYLSFFIALSKSVNSKVVLIMLWSVFYLLGSSLRVVFPRYLLIVLPFLYLIMIYLVKYAYSHRRK